MHSITALIDKIRTRKHPHFRWCVEFNDGGAWTVIARHAQEAVRIANGYQRGINPRAAIVAVTRIAIAT